MSAPEPSDEERAALLRFETLYEAWRVANEQALRAEQQLWRESLGSPDEQRRRELAAEAARLRAHAQDAYQQVIAAQRERG